MRPLLRGDVWLINFDPGTGHEQGGQRPALILSVNDFNAAAGVDLFVVPVTSKFKNLPTRVMVRSPEGGLSTDSYLICEKMRSLSKKRLRNRLGTVTQDTLNKVDTIIRMILGI